MSILTKICLIVLVVLALFACPIFITQATIVPNYRHLYEQAQTQIQLLAQTSQAERLRSEKLAEERDQLSARVEQLEKDLRDKRAEADRTVRDLQRTIAAMEGDKNILQADLRKLTTVVENDQKRITELTGDLNEARESINKLNKDMLALKSLNDEVQGERDSLMQQAKVLREYNARLENENKDLREQLAARPAPPAVAAAAPITGGPEITGRIEAVSPEDVASINIGSDKGIKRGMKLMVHRGGDFVAHLLIGEVEVGAAVGIITDKQMEPRQGDMVSTIPD